MPLEAEAVLFLLRRSRRPDPHLEWKVGIFAVAAVLTVVGIYLDERWMTMSALVVLVFGILLRLRDRGPAADTDSDEDA